MKLHGAPCGRVRKQPEVEASAVVRGPLSCPCGTPAWPASSVCGELALSLAATWKHWIFGCPQSPHVTITSKVSQRLSPPLFPLSNGKAGSGRRPAQVCPTGKWGS